MPEKTRFDKLKILDKFKCTKGVFMKIKPCTFRVRKTNGYGWPFKNANSINLETGNFEWFNNSNKIELDVAL